MSEFPIDSSREGGPLRRFFKSIGPKAFSSSEKALDKIEEQKRRLDTIEAGKAFMIKEAEGLAETKTKLFDKWVDADSLERIRIDQDLEWISRKARLYTIYAKSIDQLQDNRAENDHLSDSSPEQEISPHWMDKFNELAKADNEGWREDLLAKALAAEAKEPGSIGPRALWLIGTMEEDLFHYFAVLVDIASFANGLIIPNYTKYENEEIYVSGKNRTLSNLLYLLDDVNLLGNPIITTNTLVKEFKHLVWYGDKYFLLLSKQDVVISGLAFTPLGVKVAKLYSPKMNSIGKKIFNDWVSSIEKDEDIEVSTISTEEGLKIKIEFVLS